MNIGARILILLEEQEISQREFARLMHINYSTINGYIRNRRLPDCETIMQMAQLLNSSTDYLMGYSNIRCHTEYGYSKEEQLLVNYYRCLNDDLKKLLIDLSESLYHSQNKHRGSDASIFKL